MTCSLNQLANRDVPAAMVAAFAGSAGAPVAERRMRALEPCGIHAGDIARGCDEPARQHRRISVRLEEGDHDEVLAALEAGRTEIALTYDFGLPEGLIVTPIAQLSPVVVLPTRHRLAKLARVSLRELAEEPFLLLDLPHSRDYFTGLFRAHGLSPRIAFRSRSQELLRGLVGNGLGWTVQNVQPQSPYAVDGSRITFVPADRGLPPVRLVLAAAPGPAGRPAVKALARYVRSAFARGGLFDERGARG